MSTNNENIRRDALHRVSATDSISDQPRKDAISAVKRGLLQGMGIALGFFGTTVFAVAISGTIKTWTSGEVLKSADLNTTISSMKTAIEGITSSQWTTSGSNISYTSGSVGIGTASPANRLDVRGTLSKSTDTMEWISHVSTNDTIDPVTIRSGIRVHGTATTRYGSIDVIEGVSTRSLVLQYSGGNVGIGATTPSQTLTVNGNAGNTTGVWVNNSDERLKKNIQPLGNFLEKLTELRPVTFEWKDPKKLNAKDGKHIGFIAQEVEKVFPHWVDTDKDGMKWLSMEGVNAAFVQSFKEVAFRLRSTNDSVSAVTQKIESLEKEKAANEKKISALEADNKRLHELVETLNASVGTHGRTSQRMEDRLNALERMQIATAAQAARK